MEAVFEGAGIHRAIGQAEGALGGLRRGRSAMTRANDLDAVARGRCAQSVEVCNLDAGGAARRGAGAVNDQSVDCADPAGAQLQHAGVADIAAGDRERAACVGAGQADRAAVGQCRHALIEAPRVERGARGHRVGRGRAEGIRRACAQRTRGHAGGAGVGVGARQRQRAGADLNQ